MDWPSVRDRSRAIFNKMGPQALTNYISNNYIAYEKLYATFKVVSRYFNVLGMNFSDLQ
jgi:hypothetical protein